LDEKETTQQFYELIWPHRTIVLRTAQFLVHNLDEAEDLAQETMIKAFKSLHQFQPGTSAKNWLMTILRHTRIDRLRSTASTPKNLSLDEMEIEARSTQPIEFGEEQWSDPEQILNQFGDHEILSALHQLSEEVRWTLLLVDVEGMDDPDAAAVLDVPVGTIKSRAHRGRALLRKALLPVAREKRLIRD
jgi:RNA polymerase sigma-70 factor (ECF subfamily)